MLVELNMIRYKSFIAYISICKRKNTLINKRWDKKITIKEEWIQQNMKQTYFFSLFYKEQHMIYYRNSTNLKILKHYIQCVDFTI